MTTISSDKYTVSFSIRRSEKFQRPLVIVRVIIAFLIDVLPIGLVFLFLPAITAALISGSDGRFNERYLANYRRGLRAWTGFVAWLYCVTDEFPAWDEERAVTLHEGPPPAPTVKSALLRYIYVVPHALVLTVFGVVAWAFAIVAAVSILFTEEVPEVCKSVGSSYAAYMGRVLAYYTSVADEYPPFTFDVEA